MTVSELLPKIYNVVMKPVIGLLFGVAFVYFVYGVFKFIGSQGNDAGREEAKRSILYGILGMVIMVSVFGIIRIVGGTIGVPDIPQPPHENIFPNVTGGL